MSDKPQAFVDFLNAVSPHVSGEVRRGIESIQGLLAQFPGQSASDIAATIERLRAAAQSSVAAMIERARKVIQPASLDEASPETAEQFLKAAGKLSLDDLQALVQGLGVPLEKKTKKAVAESLKLWIESNGTYAPKSKEEKMRERVRELVGDLPQKMGQMTGALADEIIQRAEQAANDKQLGAEGFAMFASLLLGMPMKGTKPKLLKEIKSFVDRLAVSAAQTSGY